MSETTYVQLESRLFARARMGMKPGLERVHQALAALGDPHLCAPSFLVAGTNGKGSTCAFLEAVCRQAKLRTGLFTSPHLERFGERFRIAGQEADEGTLLTLWEELEKRLPSELLADDGLTFFEIVTLLGFLHFARSSIDVMIVEVGMGGRLDSTNVLSPMVSCITTVGLDHQEFLGSTLGAIAREKAGILRAGRPGVIARQPNEAAVAIRSLAGEIDARLHEEGADFGLQDQNGALGYRSEGWTIEALSLGLLGRHQHSNAAVAIRALELASPRLRISPAHVAAGVAAARWPGRLEQVLESPCPVILDGAHNPPAATALASSVRELWPRRRVHMIVGLLGDKEAEQTLAPLLDVASTVWVTQPDSPRALAAGALGSLAAASHGAVRVEADARRALDRALARASGEDVVVVCGSLYLVGELRAALQGRTAGGPREFLRPGSHEYPRAC